LNKVKQIQITW